MTDPDAPVVRSTATAIDRVQQRAAEHAPSPGTCDRNHIDRIGKPDT